MHRREPAPDLELAARVADLDSRDVLRQLERAGRDARPVRMREIATPPCASIHVAVRSRSRVLGAERAADRGLGRDAVAEHVTVTCAGEDAVQLDAREHEQIRSVDGASVRFQWSVIASTS